MVYQGEYDGPSGGHPWRHHDSSPEAIAGKVDGEGADHEQELEGAQQPNSEELWDLTATPGEKNFMLTAKFEAG